MDGVVEHQATQDGMYWHFFHSVCFIALLAVPSLLWKRSEAKYFLFVYVVVALYFSKKMNRLVLLLVPAASVLAGIAISGIFTWTLVQVWELVESVLSPLKTVKKVSTKTVNGAASKVLMDQHRLLLLLPLLPPVAPPLMERAKRKRRRPKKVKT